MEDVVVVDGAPDDDHDDDDDDKTVARPSDGVRVDLLLLLLDGHGGSAAAQVSRPTQSARATD